MIITTTPTVEGQTIKEYLGVVTGEAILGANVFKDRGALDRADVSGPFAELIRPRDNDADDLDQDPNETYVDLESGVLSNFEILLVDTDGDGLLDLMDVDGFDPPGGDFDYFR